MKEYKKVNIVFLITVLIVLGLNMINLGSICKSYSMILLISQLGFGGPALIYVAFVKKSFAAVRFKKVKFTAILLCIPFYICAANVMAFLNAISMLYSKNSISSVIFTLSDEVPYIVALLLVAIIPAFLEELTYRGMMCTAYREVSPAAAIIISGMVFGLMHGNLNQFTYAAALGIAFAYLAEATGSIIPTMIIHAIVNSLSVTVMYLLPKFLNFVKELSASLTASGDAQLNAMLGDYFGVNGQYSMDAILDSLSNGLSKQQAIASIAMYLIPAVGGLVGAYFLLKAIAAICGRRAELAAVLPHRKKTAGAQAVSIEAAAEEPVRIGRLFTVPFIIGAVLALAIMVISELALRGIIN